MVTKNATRRIPPTPPAHLQLVMEEHDLHGVDGLAIHLDMWTKRTSGFKESDMAISSRFLTLARWIKQNGDTGDMFDVVAEFHCSSGVGKGGRSTDGQIVASPSKGSAPW
ncbi:hypothetical protein GWK47_052789 [Chionoecetes opilio]|uniref:Uncharacterized protein n=1 Tax=Chionoecetes opilio TaxID=41210 RepID=A0A8J4XZP2_CHIOP|nr:hypothetical protein GWK47_052789 [Chionoecetes opilio]